jgi:hypothetical protein
MTTISFLDNFICMQNQYYDFSVPIFIKMLGGLKNVIEKARVVAGKTEGGEEVFLDKRLAPDMFPFSRQIQIACDNAKGATARLASVEIPKYEDTEKTFLELEARIDKTIAFLNTFTSEQFEHANEKKIELQYFPGKHMMGDEYLKEYALPNFFFHVATAYAIVRSLGGELGKPDYINGLPLKDNS